MLAASPFQSHSVPSFSHQFCAASTTTTHRAKIPPLTPHAINTMPRHFLTVCDLSRSELDALFALSQALADAFRDRAMPQTLKGKRVALSFEDGGFRNRVAFELGIREMGGEAVYIPGRPGEREPADDMARYLSNWFDAIVIRTPEYEVVRQVAQAARVPVINARTRHNHPCEILGDLAYVQKVRGTLDELTTVFVGEATNLCHSWFEAAAQLPINVIQVCPHGFEVNADFVSALVRDAIGTVSSTQDFDTSLRMADVVYTDCWPNRNSKEESEQIAEAFGAYRITAAALETTPKSCVFLPCPPVTRGEEVSDDAMTCSRTKIFEAKDYLLHAQNALLSKLVSPAD
jgi:ornithine carbamoyltransferase